MHIKKTGCNCYIPVECFGANEEYMSMASFYFFKHGGICETMTGFLRERVYEKYLQQPVEYNGRNVKFYLILNWIHRNNHGANIGFLEQYNMNYVPTLNDLPEGAGAYAVGYDLDLGDLEQIRKKGIPLIEDSCPRIKLLRNQLLNSDSGSHQLVFMIYDYHLIYKCYESAFPDDIIIINPENYETQLLKNKNEKPVRLLVYGVFRPKEVESVVSLINTHYFHENNILDSYNETRCCWTKQGLLEEIEDAVKQEKIDEVWIICSNEEDTSTRGIIKESRENGADTLIIKSQADIPERIDDNRNYGVIIAPIPISDDIKKCVSLIRERFT